MRLKDIDKFPLLPNKLDGDESEYERGYHDATANLNALPTIDPESLRPKGKWIDGMKCSECGQVDFTKPNFCPDCGADMRGE